MPSSGEACRASYNSKLRIQTEVWKFFDECDVMSLEKCQSYAMEHTVYSNRYKFGVAMYQVPWNYCRL